jgi:hypothetical protein
VRLGVESKEGDLKKKKVELLISRRMFLSSMNRSLVGVGDHQVRTKDSNVTTFFFLMCEDLI